jgi:Holliday junction resolvasome RuvABC endonuclease subunit
MGKRLAMEQVKSEAAAHGWSLVSLQYQNLQSPLIFRCPEGHLITITLKAFRAHPICPTCKNTSLSKQAIKLNGSGVVTKSKDINRSLALDQSSQKTGFSIWDDDKLIEYGTINFTDEKPEVRMLQEKQWILSMIETWHIDVVGIEEIFLNPHMPQVYKVLSGTYYVLLVMLVENKIKYFTISPATWRAHCKVTSKYSKNIKQAMQELVLKIYGKSVSEDEADSIGLGKCLVEALNPRQWQKWG